MNLNIVEVLEAKDEGKSLEFRQNDIVSIYLKTYSVGSRPIRGRITTIESSSLEVDCSKEFKSFTKCIKYEDIYKIEKIAKKS